MQIRFHYLLRSSLGTHSKLSIVNIHIRHKPVELDEDSLPCGERLINLDPTRTVLQIGRASKSPSKGLSGAIDNAWFDSPVMSRNHAEIIYSPLDNVRMLYC